MKKSILVTLMLAVSLSACTTPAPATTQAGSTEAAATTVASDNLNPCDKSVLTDTVKPFTDLTREFDDTSYVASFTPQSQLVEPVLKLQDVRRRVQALDTPDCLKNLRKYQIDYMNAVIAALVHFLGGAKGDQVQAEIGATRALRQKYDKELATVLGITFVAPTTAPTQTSGTPAPAVATVAPTEMAVTPTATPGEAPTPAPVTVTVIQRANLRRGPGTDFDLVATLNASETAIAVGRNAAGDWIQVENPAGPDGKAWLLATLVTVNAPIDQLPIVNPP
jgi:hypothetical protein